MCMYSINISFDLNPYGFQSSRPQIHEWFLKTFPLLSWFHFSIWTQRHTHIPIYGLQDTPIPADLIFSYEFKSMSTLPSTVLKTHPLRASLISVYRCKDTPTPSSVILRTQPLELVSCPYMDSKTRPHLHM